MFEAPVTFIESKKQKTSFEDVDGNKVIGYLEKDSPGTSNIINFRILIHFHTEVSSDIVGLAKSWF